MKGIVSKLGRLGLSTCIMLLVPLFFMSYVQAKSQVHFLPGQELDSELFQMLNDREAFAPQQHKRLSQGSFFLPGYNVTLLEGYAVEFCVEDGFKAGQELVITGGQQEYRKEITDLKVVTVAPEEMKMPSGKVYTWKIAGSGLDDIYKLRLLGNDLAEKIKRDLAKIDAAEGSEQDKILAKAAYLQVISDRNPDKIDLYWLSYQFLNKLDGNLNEVKNLKEYYSTHLEVTAPK
ncbi:MAG: hypothetical protein P4N59_11755 [Negativicutes bacterium]|nr:hypothetical protein [Negativicutes bacterium]